MKLYRVIPFATSILLLACQPDMATPEPNTPTRPDFELTTTEAYDFSSIADYDGDHAAIYDHIDANIDRHLQAIQRWLRQPSISAQNVGVQDMAEMLRGDLEGMGFAEANLVDHELGRVLMARGATNQKGPERAFLNALESIIEVEGNLPVNIMVAAEGEEELGSPHYHQIVDAYYDRLSTADGALFPFNSQRPDGNIFVILGVSRWIDNKMGNDAVIELLYQPTLNIDGIWGGYTEEGVKTILPHTASAKVDSRLPPCLDPDAALAVFKKHAESLSVQPRIAGSAPFYQFTERLGLPLTPAGMGFGTGAHAPNEIMLIEPKEGSPVAGLAEIEKAYVDFVYALAR